MSAAVCANCGRAVAFEGGRVTYCGEGCEAARLALEAPGGQPEAAWREGERGANEGAAEPVAPAPVEPYDLDAVAADLDAVVSRALEAGRGHERARVLNLIAFHLARHSHKWALRALRQLRRDIEGGK